MLQTLIWDIVGCLHFEDHILQADINFAVADNLQNFPYIGMPMLYFKNTIFNGTHCKAILCS